MLTPQQVNQYHEKGYVTATERLPADVINDIKEAHNRLLAKYPEFYHYCPNLLGYDTWYLAIARTPYILDCVEQVLGPDIALWNASFFAKPANGGHATPWHQDGEYWPIRPLATCTVWIAIDAATPENGCLKVIPGSHTDRKLRQHHTNTATNLTLSQELDTSEYNEADAVAITLEPGEISLHDVYLLHGSDANHSTEPRRGMTLRFMPTTSVYDRALATRISEEKSLVNHSERTLFLMRGADPSGLNDFRIRQ